MAQVDFYQKLENVVRLTAPTIRNYLRSEVSSSGLKKVTGALDRGFAERIRKDGLEVWGVSFRMPRYGFIHNHGMASKIVQREGHTYTHPGFKGRQFIGPAVAKGEILLRDRLSIVARDIVMDELDEVFV